MSTLKIALEEARTGVTAKAAAGAITLLMLAVFSSEARADCSNTAPTSGTTVTCSGTSNTPVIAVGGSTGDTINIAPGASVGAPHTKAVPFPLISVESGSIITNGGTLTLTGSGGSGTNRGAAMLADINSDTLTNKGAIGTSGAFNDGMAANGSGNTLTNSGTIATTGPNAYGMTAAEGQTNTGQLNNALINTGSVTTSGSNARAASILGGSGTINNSGTLTTTGTGSVGAYMQGNNDRLVNSGKISVSGTSEAVFSNTVGSNFTATIQNLASGQITSANGPAIRTLNGATTIINAGLLQSGGGTAIQGGNGDISLTLQTGSKIVGAATGGSGDNTVTLQGTGTAANPFVNFQTLLMRGATWNFTGTGTFTDAVVRSGTLNLTGNLGVGTNMGVSTGATLNMQGVSQTFHDVTNNGVIVTGGAPGTNLTVSDYLGHNGTLKLNTFVGGEGSPSDRLVINGGKADGTTGILITNVGGPGAQSTTNGILVVDAVNGATTAKGAFTLRNPELRVGAFDYRLFQGSPSDPALANDWFLRTALAPPVQQPMQPAPGPLSSAPSPQIQPAPLPPASQRIIGPELATYGVVQPIAREIGLSTLGGLHERIGAAAADEACLNAASGTSIAETNCRQAIWGRMFGQQIDNRYQSLADPRASGQVAGIQTGIDVWRGSLIPGHSDTAGVYFAYTNGNVGVNGLVTNPAATANILQHTGALNLDAYSFGGYWTHYGPAGWYVDAVLQGSVYNGNATTQFANLQTDGTGIVTSLETGYPIQLPSLGPGFVLEPEAQIIWQQVRFDQATDSMGPVGLGTTSGASGRFGLRGKWTVSDRDGRVWQPYVLANVWRDWDAAANTMFGTDSVPLAEQATRLEFAGGFSAKLLPGLSLYAQAGYQFATSSEFRRDGVEADFGVHDTW